MTIHGKKGSTTILAIGLLAGSARVHAADTLFVSDFADGTIYRFNLPSPAPISIVSGLLSPEDGDCSPAGLIYFAESNFNQVSRWQQDGSNEENICPTSGTVNGPEGLTFDVAGNLYINTRNMGLTAEGGWKLDGGDPLNPVTQIVPNFSDWGEGSTIVLAGPHAGAWLLVARAESKVVISEPPGAPPVDFILPAAFPAQPPADIHIYGVATNGCGEVFVAFSDFNSFNGSAVYRFDAEGNFLDVYLANLQSAAFLEFDSLGDLYVADQSASTIWRVRPDRSFMPFASGFAIQPTGVAICRTRQVPTCATAITCNAGGPYAAECDGTTTCLAVDGSASTGTGLSYEWTSDCPGGTFTDPTAVSTTLCVQSITCPTTCTATLKVSQGSTSKSCTAEVRVEDSLPPAFSSIPTDVGAECDKVPVAPVLTASDRCDPDVPVAFNESKAPGRCPGEYVLTRDWTASDDCGHPISTRQTVTVVDTTPPTIAANSDQLACLWPPNHWYVCFSASDLDVKVSDNCSEPVTWIIDGCASDQPDDARESDPNSPWNGDGHTTEDCVVLPDGAGFCVRAERAGTGPTAQDGRHYGVTVIAVDACGNKSAPLLAGTIHVPHDQSPAEKSCIKSTEVGCHKGPLPCAVK